MSEIERPMEHHHVSNPSMIVPLARITYLRKDSRALTHFYPHSACFYYDFLHRIQQSPFYHLLDTVSTHVQIRAVFYKKTKPNHSNYMNLRGITLINYWLIYF